MSVLMTHNNTNTPNQLGSTLPKPLESAKTRSASTDYILSGGLLCIFFARFKTMIVDKGVKQVGHNRNDPVSVDVKSRDRSVQASVPAKQVRCFNWCPRGLPDLPCTVLPLCKCTEESGPTYCHSLGKLMIQSHRTTASIEKGVGECVVIHKIHPHIALCSRFKVLTF
jgi:hypothetical protein